jgi:dienelactone hydrolase
MLLAFASQYAAAQNAHVFTKGLAAPGIHRYGREAVVMDQLAYQLHAGKLKTPQEGVSLFTNSEGKDVTWKSVTVDSTGKFRGELLSGGYIFLEYNAKQAQPALLNVSGNSMVYFNGEPHAGDIYADGWMNIPIILKRGVNEIYVRCGTFARWQGISAQLKFVDKGVFISTEDTTLPHIVIGKQLNSLVGAVVLVNHTNKSLTGLKISALLNGKTVTSDVPAILKGTMRKISFSFDPSGIQEKGDYPCTLILTQSGKVLDEKQITITAVLSSEHHSYTFISNIDGSVQYYSVAPPSRDLKNPALFLSVHGAGVQAIGQARAYTSKDWGVLVAPTNRRPRGFNWEDWGRIDALEVLELAKKQYQPDPERIYLTGHSMGGHGTWYLGATYPDKWAAIAPCAGYPTLTGYGSADGKIPEQSRSAEEKILLRASNPSNVIELSRNYRDVGVYVHHGDDDRVVSVNYARQMRKILGDFHKDFSYYEYPGGSHWFGNESVDWPPLFEYFKWHKIDHDTTFRTIEFTTANPAISSSYRWASVVQQIIPLDFSSIHLSKSKDFRLITGTTKNVAILRLKTNFVTPGDSLVIKLDSVTIRTVATTANEIWLRGFPDWKVGNAVTSNEKNQIRSGTLKEAFNNKMVFVYATHGSKEENAITFNKARYDAEMWYYRGNGSVDIVTDDVFEPTKYKDRGVIIYGNNSNNSAWNKLLKNCPVSVSSNLIKIGDKTFTGKDLGIYFTWPRQDSDIAMVGVIGGTGVEGLKATEANQYFAAGSGFPDYMVFSLDMLDHGAAGVKAAGFYDNQWQVKPTSPTGD